MFSPSSRVGASLQCGPEMSGAFPVGPLGLSVIQFLVCLAAKRISGYRQRKRQPSLSLNNTDFVTGDFFYTWVAAAIGEMRLLGSPVM